MNCKRTMVAIAVMGALACASLFADDYADALSRFNDLKKQVQQKDAEVQKLRKENPACLLGAQTRSILNLEKKMPTREQKRYYFRQVTYVRPHFWCTKCRGEDHDESPCKTSAKQSWPRWREHLDKIKLTAECNEKIDALMTEYEDLQKQLAEAKKAKDTALAEKKKAAAGR